MYQVNEKNPRKEYLKALAIVAIATFSITLAVIVGSRLSDEALAVLAGAVCGVGAAIPTSLLVVAVTRRRHQATDQPVTQSPSHRAYPPVVVVSPGSQPYWQPGQLPRPETQINHIPVPREFTVVGGDGDGTE